MCKVLANNRVVVPFTDDSILLSISTQLADLADNVAPVVQRIAQTLLPLTTQSS
jgi:hypothetical protein